ncbi:MAG: NADPH-dependent glutamate synthase [Endomicrobium sp.]|nr:NADPH-dependent glutamate synthase [Endomicrobium sp.]
MKVFERNPNIRKKDFEQVSRTYTQEEMLIEANRCLRCKIPSCVNGCPVGIDIPGFIKCLVKNDIKQAITIIKRNNNLPAVCGRVCPQENQCEKFCILSKKNESICIGNLERYTADKTIGDYYVNNNSIVFGSKNIKVAIIGSGPAGLTCAGDLLKFGYNVTVYESLHDAGGVLRYGIPKFRLPKNILNLELSSLKKNGMKIILNTLIGRTKTVKELLDNNYKAVFIAVGAGLPVFPKIQGESLNNVYSANEFLVRVNLMHSINFPNYDTPVYKAKNAVVIGGGNTAMDTARTLIRLGVNSVKLVYRKTENEMPARKEERIHAIEEGVKIIILTKPLRFIGDEKGFVEGVECIRVTLKKNDLDKIYLQEVQKSNYIIKADMVVLALGLYPNPILPSIIDGLATDENGYILIDENFMTTLPGIFAGGDVIGGATVIEAMSMGKKAAKSINKYLSTSYD